MATRLPWLVGTSAPRREEMNVGAVHLLRRLALALLALSVLLVAGYRLAREAGLVGPGAQALVAQAAGGVEAARLYGADPSLAPYVHARSALAEARSELARGDERAARRQAREALDSAVAAQRMALVRGERQREHASAAAEQVGREVDRLERLYDEVTPALPRAEVTRLFNHMKRVRQAGAALALAHEQGDYARVVRDEAAARQVLEAMRQELRAARPR